jgi:hypothetical protein
MNWKPNSLLDENGQTLTTFYSINRLKDSDRRGKNSQRPKSIVDLVHKTNVILHCLLMLL